MKTFKRIQAMFLAVVMAVMTIGATTAFAAERSIVERRLFPPEGFSISTTHSAAGQSFTSPSNELHFEASFSKSNTIVAIRLHDQTTGAVTEWQDSTGKFDVYVNVTAGNSYIFEYLVASGSGTVYVSNAIYAVYRN